ncbi:3-deoxy-7-phosphoheptulonate synthase [Candidatus Woesearchaeota archaeon]|nr:3-deoxy-7-phosphoheptulonate synthase [Candidatus Woesearchaeota archaeon]
MLQLRADVTPQQIKDVESAIRELGLRSQLVIGETAATLQVIGDETDKDLHVLAGMQGVEKVTPVNAPYKLVSRRLHPEYGLNGHTKVVNVAGVEIGGTSLVVMGGPCAVYNRQQVLETARAAKEAGARIMRGGAYKPRSSPHSFQGLGKAGLEMLMEAKQETGLPVVTEVLDPRHVELVAQYADMFQIGTRNAQNFELLREVGRSRMPVLLKRGFAATLEEWLCAAEYIASEGNMNIVLCERGMKTPFQSSENGRFNFDIQAIPAVKALTYLPVIADPSHSTGKRALVTPIALAAVAAGTHGLILDIRREADGPIIEYVKDGVAMKTAYCDYEQALTPKELETLAVAAKAVHTAMHTPV